MKEQGNIEVELRGMMTNQDRLALLSFFHKKNIPIEKDNKISYFFVTNGFILKVSEETDKNQAKITVKSGDETKNILQEYEILIDKNDIEKALRLFIGLGYSKINRVAQDRMNIKYKGAEISLKYSEDWGFHFEIEKMASSVFEAKNIKESLREICCELGLRPMNSREIKEKIESINRSHGFIE